MFVSSDPNSRSTEPTDGVVHDTTRDLRLAATESGAMRERQQQRRRALAERLREVMPLYSVTPYEEPDRSERHDDQGAR